MKRFLLASLASAALVLSPAYTRPAQANEGAELFGLLLGIGTVYAIGKGIEQARAPKAVDEAVVEPVADRARGVTALPPATAGAHRSGPCPATACRPSTQARGNAGFGADCLARGMRRLDRLPAMCAIDTRVGHREARIYSARCLRARTDLGGRKPDGKARLARGA